MSSTPELNIGNSIFEGFNDKNGILLCGYEWGGDPSGEGPDFDRLKSHKHTFSNKAPGYGDAILNEPYDRRLIKWFGLWGHPLSREGLGGNFEKSLIQTNWCDTQATDMRDVDVYGKLLDPLQVDNFLFHVATLEPRVIFFLGIKQLECLQHPDVLPKFERIAGKSLGEPNFVQKPFEGTRFKVGFQNFENIRVIALPHPSGTIGLHDSYLSLFKDEIGSILSEFKSSRINMEIKA